MRYVVCCLVVPDDVNSLVEIRGVLIFIVTEVDFGIIEGLFVERHDVILNRIKVARNDGGNLSLDYARIGQRTNHESFSTLKE